MMGNTNRAVLVLLVAAGMATGASAPAAAQSDEIAKSVVDFIGSSIANSRLRKSIADISSPLAYEPAAGPVDATDRADPRNHDVAGVRLGMTPAEVARALRANGYTKDGDKDGQWSYDSVVRQARASRFGGKPGPATLVPKMDDWVKAGQRVSVGFVALPEGPRVNMVQYSAGEAAISEEAFLDQVNRRYGEPVNDDSSDLRWCTVTAPDCEDAREAKYPVLAAWPQARSIILGGNDPALRDALEARKLADVEKRRPSDAAAEF